MRVEFTFQGEPVPAMRPRLGRGGTYNPPKYTAYKESLANAIKAEYGYLAWDIPGANVPNERKKFIKNNQYSLDLRVYCKRAGQDVDNLLKTVMDALQTSGVIANDSQIIGVTVIKHSDKENPRLEFVLEKLNMGMRDLK